MILSHRRGRLLTLCTALTLLVGLIMASPAAASPRNCTNGRSLKQVTDEPVANTMPVLFVHGMNAGADTWDGPVGPDAKDSGPDGSDSEDSFPRKVAKLPRVSAFTFDYKPAQPEWVTDPRIGPALRLAINCLAQASGYKVMVVAHSMGGLATQYAVSLPNGRAGGKTWQDVAEVITIGTPTRGSIMASIARHLPVPLGRKAFTFIEGILGVCALYGSASDDSLCGIFDALRAPQGRALAYESEDIKNLPPWPKELPVRAIAGDIKLSFNSIFGVTSLPGASVGDVAVSLGSATAYTNKTGTPHVLTCRNNQVPLRVLGSDCNHVNVKTQPTVVATVIKQIQRVEREQTSLRAPELAYASGNTITLWTDGKGKALATIPNGYRAEQIAWSGSGLSVAWTAARDDGSERKVYLVLRGRGDPPSSPRIRSWSCDDCSTIAFRDEELVSDGASTPEQAALWSYPSSGEARKLAPVRDLRPIDDCFGPSCGRLNLLGPGPNGTVSVAYIDAGGNFTGVGTLYQVDAQGHVNEFDGVDGSGRLGGETVSPLRDKVAIPWFGHSSYCEEWSGVAVLDQKSGKVTQPNVPNLSGNVWLLSSWFDSRGQAHAAFRSEPGCEGTADQLDSNGQRILRWGATHVYRLVGSHWIETNEAPVLARDVHRGGRTASLLGTPPDTASGGHSEGRLVAQNAANETVDVAKQVHAFAWRPQTP
ncbi:esterase/lipase family protein [Streptomyces sp. NPDC001312]|uniref:esterase/lipase family protein n=1 Tax=Streptomyces sp. NPDC001312 TaxID=3364561 RepID=UPI0036BFCD56